MFNFENSYSEKILLLLTIENLTQSLLVIGLPLMTLSEEQLAMESNDTTFLNPATLISHLIFAYKLSYHVEKRFDI